MAPPTVVVSEFMDEPAVARLSQVHPTTYDPGLVDQPEALQSALAGARALVVRNRTQVTAELLDQAPALEVVGRLGVGLDNIDMAACKARGVAVHPARGANADAVAEYVIAAALQMLRGGAFFATEAVQAGEWPRDACQGGEMAGRTLGLLGFGDIAQRTARRARALGMTIIAHDPMVTEAAEATLLPFDALLAAADILSLHVPLTDATRGLFDADALGRMKRDAILINTARGGIVDEAALAEALKAGRLGGAALDVFAVEPLDAEAARAFQGVPNLILTPHIAGVTAESNERVSAMIADAVLEALA
ncbi:hydroxyacid dehydrogenase [Pelagibius litoralis]|uniref:Hydroxyacid dehydrogenase n=1 Tax=Pelagibius litoralis TaxID=374515 RepID=A0A967KFT3_9PROT|nr:hydroxyacid dehydrogenase [Pelagibius litoralis]NIA69796.1 hydroxyacid dehydrogenase [Pelagibius litoralis]